MEQAPTGGVSGSGRGSGSSSQEREKIESLYTMANVLNTGLDRRMIPVLLELLECGIHPESLAEGKHRFLLPVHEDLSCACGCNFSFMSYDFCC
jgi:hypothetical protein